MSTNGSIVVMLQGDHDKGVLTPKGEVLAIWTGTYLKERVESGLSPDVGLFTVCRDERNPARHTAETVVVFSRNEKPARDFTWSYTSDINLHQVAMQGLRQVPDARTVLFVGDNPDKLRQICSRYKPRGYGKIPFEEGGFALMRYRRVRDDLGFFGFEFHRLPTDVRDAYLDASRSKVECPECGRNLIYREGGAICPNPECAYACYT